MFLSLINCLILAPCWNGCVQGCLKTAWYLSPCSCYFIASSKGTFEILRNLCWEVFILTVKSIYICIPDKGCVWLFAAMPVLTLFALKGKPRLTHILEFQLVYSNVLWFTVWDKLSLMLKFCLFWFWFFFYFHALRKLSKRAINSLLYIVNALRMAVNLSLKAVYKTAETHWWCCQDNEN